MNDDLVHAIDLALDDEWEEAHGIAQRYESDTTAQWIHAVLHKIEGDLANSRYWYRQAGRLDWVDKEPLDELRSIRALLTS